MTRSSRPPERSPSPEETLLWRWMTRHDAAYHEEPPLQALLDVDDYAGEQEQKQPTPLPSLIRIGENSVTAKQKPQQALQMGSYHGVDRRTAQRMKRGQLPVDVILDLHGNSQIEACERLYKCIVRAVEQQKKLALIITGKGRMGEGVLRQQLPHWLNDAALRPYVLAFDQASVRDGAGGAYYVLLKRKRIIL